MARIRTIKPEFPQSEKIGRLSRDARLLFIQLWTVSDDEGRLRGASRMLASLLYPYDDDVPGLIDGWLNELEQEKCIIRYAVDCTSYIQIANWLEHQKIDRPSKSRIPEFENSSRVLARYREHSRTSDADLGPRTIGSSTKDHDERLRARENAPLIAREANDLADAFLVAIGFSDPMDIPPEFCGTLMRADQWHRAGWPKSMIVSEAQRVMDGRPGPPSLKYFEKVFANKFASLNAPAPVGQATEKTHAATGNVIAAADRLIEQLKQFDEPAPSNLRIGTG